MKFIKIANTISRVLLDYQKELAKIIKDAELDYIRQLGEEYNRLGYKTFINYYGYGSYEVMRQPKDDRLDKKCERKSKQLVEKIWNKSQEKLGNIINTDVYFNGADIDGTITGENGIIELRTIIASGPIQRTHFRHLLKFYPKKEDK